MIYITPRKSIDRVVIRGGHFDGNARENPPAWTPGERVEVDEFRRNADARTSTDRVYRCTSPGTTALSGAGPQGNNAAILDADVVWEYVADTRSWFGWEQSSLVMIAAAEGVSISTVLVEDLLVEDPTADGVRVIANRPGSVVELFAARNIRSIKRFRPRADIIWYQRVRHSLITDCHVQRIETEPTGPPLPAGQDNLIANCVTDIFDIAGKGAENAALFRFFVTNLVAKRATYLGSPRAHFSNCDLMMRPTDGRVFGNKTFMNCHFRIQFDAAAKAWVPIRPSYLPEADTESRFTRCTFSGVSRDRGPYEATHALRNALPAAEQGDYVLNEETETVWAWDRTTESWVDLETSAFLPEGPAIRPVTVVPVDEPWARRLILDGCTFARDDFEHCLMIYRCGMLVSTGNTYRSRGGAIATMTSGETRAEVRSIGDDFSGAANDLVIGHVPESSFCRILIDGIQYGAKPFRTAGSTWINARIASGRIVMIESEDELRGGLVGDVARLLPAAGEGWISGTFEWLCIKSHPTQAVWIPNRTIGGSGRE